jgi:hypothetical protein
MLNNVQIGANQDRNVTIDGITKTMKEWQDIEHGGDIK